MQVSAQSILAGWQNFYVIVGSSMTEELGRAMLRVARQGASKRVLENRNLIALGVE